MDTGIRVTVEELRHLRADSIRLANTPRDAVSNLFPGAYRAMFRGRGLEFNEVRPYQSGDDYRTLDWRVTARTGKLHTKLFQEEREHTIYLLVDAGSSMQFGTRIQYKWVLAARIAALITWMALESGDRVGAIVYGDGLNCHISPPLGGEAGAMRVFSLLAGIKPHATNHHSTLSDAMLRLRKLAKPGSMILVLSDFHELDPGATQHLAYLARHNDIAAVHIYDPIERELPPPGIYSITDGSHSSVFDSGQRSVRKRYHQLFQQRVERVKHTCTRYQARLLSLGTDQPLVEGLQQALFPGIIRGNRQGRGRGNGHA
ncbi:MAG: DUF58 domain-containing protein [Gammaproteobacteria bacterium]|nr:DUF58 domain-containing protein [Gammaproteobacteria bacterium]